MARPRAGVLGGVTPLSRAPGAGPAGIRAGTTADVRKESRAVGQLPRDVPPQPTREKAAQLALSLQDGRRVALVAAATLAAAAAFLVHRHRCRP